MRLSTPWSPEGEPAQDAATDAIFPGVGDSCELPHHRVKPVVHRFEYVVVLEENAVRIPALSDWLPLVRRESVEADPFAAELRGILGLTGASFADAVDTLAGELPDYVIVGGFRAANDWQHRPWELRRPLSAIHLVVDQAWDALGVTLGEPIGSISLAPAEERSIEVFEWHKVQETLDLSTTEIVDRQVSTHLTTHDSFQVVHRAEKESHWEASSELSYGKGAASGSVSASTGGSSSDLVERQFERTRDLTRKVSEQIRSERKTRITTVEDTGREERRTMKLQNPNACHSVSYEFYEQLSHYRVRSAPSQISYAIVVPNPLPEITPEWVSCHEGILRDALLDESVADGFEAARRLLLSSPRSALVEAALKLQAAFRPVNRPPPSDDGGLLDFFTDLAGSLVGSLAAVAELLAGGGGGDSGRHPVDGLGNPPSTRAVQGYLKGLVREPSLTGLGGALLLIARYYRDLTMPAGMQTALGFAVNLIAAELGAAGSAPDDAEEEAAAGGVERDIEQVREDKKQRAEAALAFERLQCHLEEHLLHYMRRIWILEDPAARYARLSSYSIAGSRLWDLAENRLLGFHLNGSIYPVALGQDLEDKLRSLIEDAAPPIAVADLPVAAGMARFAATVPATSREFRDAVVDGLDRTASSRGRALRSGALNDALVRSVTRTLPTIASLYDTSRPDGDPLADALRQAGARLENISDDALLTPHEKAMQENVDEQTTALTSLDISTGVFQSHFSELVETGRRMQELASQSDMLLALPTGALHLEPLVGRCSACDEASTRKLEADVESAEARRDIEQLEAQRRRKRIDQGQLDVDPHPATIRVLLESDT